MRRYDHGLVEIAELQNGCSDEDGWPLEHAGTEDKEATRDAQA